MARPVALVILDGFGLAPAGPGNAVREADTPNFDRYWERYPHTQLEASGRAVGLPAGQMGNSEVGHLNLGAGRVVLQSLTLIQNAIDDGSFARNEVLDASFDAARGHALHLLGLVSDGGVHSDLPHLLALLDLAASKGLERVFVHAITDGRDTPPDAAGRYLKAVEDHIAQIGSGAEIASVSGRYYAMDRDRRWDRTARAYDAIVCGRAERFASSASDAIQQAYAAGETDEFVRPTAITDDDGRPLAAVADDDVVFFFNFRADRARQLTYALTGGPEWAEFDRCRAPRVRFASLMEYDSATNLPFAFALEPLEDCLAAVLSGAALTQFHAAETEKYAHVTYFFNAKREAPFPGEERCLVPSPKVATYDLQPQMSAPELSEATTARIEAFRDDFVLLNFANPDMVGHTGSLPAAIQACEAADAALGPVVDAVLRRGGAVLVVADHGNAEKMLEADGSPHTAHTTNAVPCVLISDDPVLRGARLRDGGVLGDVAPTVLELMALPQPEAMTGTSLLNG